MWTDSGVKLSNHSKKSEPLVGLEPTTFRSEVCCDIHFAIEADYLGRRKFSI